MHAVGGGIHKLWVYTHENIVYPNIILRKKNENIDKKREIFDLCHTCHYRIGEGTSKVFKGRR